MEIKKKSLLDGLLPSPSPVMNFGDRELSSYIYGLAYKEVCLDNVELSPYFLYKVLSEDNLRFILDVYLNLLEKEKSPKLKELSHDGKFDIPETLDSLSTDLRKDFGTNGVTLVALRERLMHIYNEENPLQKLLYGERSYLRKFCDGLDLGHKARIFLLLNLLNSVWGWIFPDGKSYSYCADVFNVFLKEPANTPTVLARKLNNRFIQLGLFSSPWVVCDYVTSFFLGEVPSYTAQRARCDPLADCYDYEALWQENKDSILTWKKLAKESCMTKKACYGLICGTESFRLRNFCSFMCEKSSLRLFELKAESLGMSRREQDFYIYAISKQVEGDRDVLLVPCRASRAYIREDTELPETFGEGVDSILSHVNAPIVLCAEKPAPDAAARLKEAGINLLFTLQLKLPDEDIYRERAVRFFYDRKIPSGLISAAAEACDNMRLSPGKWEEAADLMGRARQFKPGEAMRLLENKFREDAEANAARRKDTHYCQDALNTTEPIRDITEALKNAEEFEREEYDEKSGTRILLTGPSGTGKTAYAEQAARMLNKPLKVIRASEILGCYVGSTERNIKAAFEDAAREKAVLLIDEADSFLHSRGDSVNRHNDTKVNEFLIQMERFPGILFCNTNLPDQLDKAVDRRFHFKVGFKPLTKEGVAMLCKSYFGTFGISEAQVGEIFSAGDVCPGDFGALYGKVRFVARDKLDADYITGELCNLVKGKCRSWEGKSIGFGAR
ncbi:MAG: ATP-binding protein [Treponema sp.]|nr:ATP-binding protein [Treponema sp.]